MKKIINPNNIYKKFQKESKAVIAVEFALILPVLVLIFFFAVGALNTMACYRKLNITARAVADMVAQNSSGQITPEELDAILSASTSILLPFDKNKATVTVSEIFGTQGVVWSRSLNGVAYAKQSSNPAPPDVATINSVPFIYAEVTYSHPSPISSIFNIVFTPFLHGVSFMTPRNYDEIPCKRC